MSKASQRRLAEQQKRNRRRGTPKLEDMVNTLLLGPDAIYEAPLSFWKCVAFMGKPKKKHVDDERLEAFFKDTRYEIERLHQVAIRCAALGADCLPGIAFHGCLGAEKEGELIRLPLNPIGYALHCTSDELIEMLHNDRRESGTEDADVSVWVFGLPLPGDPILCIGVTDTGARFVKMRVEQEWIAGKEDHLLLRAMEVILDTQEAWALSSTNAFVELGDKVRSGKFADVESMNAEDLKKMAFDFQHALDMACIPYLSLSLESLDHANMLHSLAMRTRDKIKAREEELERQERKSSTELEAMRRRLALTSQRNQQAEARPAVSSEAKEVKVRGKEPKELAARLGAFF